MYEINNTNLVVNKGLKGQWGKVADRPWVGLIYPVYLY